MKKVSDNVQTFFMFDHMFHYTWLIYKTIEFDVRGAMDSHQIPVAYISSKELMVWAIKLFIYSKDETPNSIEYYMLKQLRRLLGDDTVYAEIESLFYSCAETLEEIISEIEHIRNVCASLISRELREFIGQEKTLDFSNHVGSVNKIDMLFIDLERKKEKRLAYPDEITQLIRDVGVLVTKGK